MHVPRVRPSVTMSKLCNLEGGQDVPGTAGQGVRSLRPQGSPSAATHRRGHSRSTSITRRHTPPSPTPEVLLQHRTHTPPSPTPEFLLQHRTSTPSPTPEVHLQQRTHITFSNTIGLPGPIHTSHWILGLFSTRELHSATKLSS